MNIGITIDGYGFVISSFPHAAYLHYTISVRNSSAIEKERLMNEPEMTTWDGKAVSRTEPHGASIIVYRQNDKVIELLILHRAHADEPNGDWAWTPPSGARYPGEEPADCARRELWEETGLRLDIRYIPRAVQSWYLYAAQAAPHDEIVLDGEHDQYAWAPVAEAVRRCRPAPVSDGIQTVVDALGL